MCLVLRPRSYDDHLALALRRVGGQPFTTAQAADAGLGPTLLGQMLRSGVVRRLVKGVHVVATTQDSLELRCRALRLVVPPGAVVTDRTAGWLHGVEMVLAPNDHVVVPPVSAFHRARGGRLRNDLTASGQRMMPDLDVEEVHGLLVTTRLRTALDLGRLLRREQAIAAMDQMLRDGDFTKDDVLEQAARFKGYRGVVQLRTLAPLIDGRAQSPPESVLRLRWIDCPDLPRPEPQVEVPGPAGATYWLDLGAECLRLGAEYDGEEWHGAERVDHDDERRTHVREREGWILPVFTHVDLWPWPGTVERRLRSEFAPRMRRLSRQ